MAQKVQPSSRIATTAPSPGKQAKLVPAKTPVNAPRSGQGLASQLLKFAGVSLQPSAGKVTEIAEGTEKAAQKAAPTAAGRPSGTPGRVLGVGRPPSHFKPIANAGAPSAPMLIAGKAPVSIEGIEKEAAVAPMGRGALGCPKKGK